MEGLARPFFSFLSSTTAVQSIRTASVRVRALPSPLPPPLQSNVEGDLDRPRYTGNDPLSRFVSSLIAIKPLFDVMKLVARQVFIRFFLLPSFPIHCVLVVGKNVYIFSSPLEVGVIGARGNAGLPRKMASTGGGWRTKFWRQMFMWRRSCLRTSPWCILIVSLVSVLYIINFRLWPEVRFIYLFYFKS